MTREQLGEELAAEIKLQVITLTNEAIKTNSPSNYLLLKVEDAIGFIRNSDDIEKVKDYAIMGSAALLSIGSYCADKINKDTK